MPDRRNVPACPEPDCGEQVWYRLHQYLQTDRETLGPSADQTDSDNVSVEADDVTQDWTCYAEHLAPDDIREQLDELY